MSDTPETDALREAIDNGAATEAEMTSLAGKLEQERDEARKQLRVAVGLLSTTPQFQDQHPEEVLKFVEEAAK